MSLCLLISTSIRVIPSLLRPLKSCKLEECQSWWPRLTPSKTTPLQSNFRLIICPKRSSSTRELKKILLEVLLKKILWIGSSRKPAIWPLKSLAVSLRQRLIPSTSVWCSSEIPKQPCTRLLSTLLEEPSRSSLSSTLTPAAYLPTQAVLLPSHYTETSMNLPLLGVVKATTEKAPFTSGWMIKPYLTSSSSLKNLLTPFSEEKRVPYIISDPSTKSWILRAHLLKPPRILKAELCS